MNNNPATKDNNEEITITKLTELKSAITLLANAIYSEQGWCPWVAARKIGLCN